MAEIISLSRARKVKARAVKARRELDGHKRDR